MTARKSILSLIAMTVLVSLIGMGALAWHFLSEKQGKLSVYQRSDLQESWVKFDSASGFGAFQLAVQDYLSDGTQGALEESNKRLRQLKLDLLAIASLPGSDAFRVDLQKMQDILDIYEGKLQQAQWLWNAGEPVENIKEKLNIPESEAQALLNVITIAVMEQDKQVVRDYARRQEIELQVLLGVVFLWIILSGFVCVMLVRFFKLSNKADDLVALEEVQRANIQRMRDAEKLGQVGYWKVRPVEGLVEWSLGIFEIHDRDPELGPPDLETAINYYHPDDRDAVAKDVARAMEKGETFAFERRLITEKGREKVVYSKGQGTNRNGEVTISGVFMDVTELTQMKQDYALILERFFLARDAAHIGVWDYDLQSGHLVWDEGMFEIYNMDETKFSGSFEDWAKAVYPEDLARASEDLREAIASKTVFESRFRLADKDDKIRWIMGRAKVLLNDHGDPVRVVGVNQDITDIVEAEVKLQEALVQAENASNAKSDFLAVMSHEVRTPLNAIMGMLQILNMRKLSEEDHNLVDIALTSSNQLLTILSDILEMSRIEAGKLDINKKPFNPVSTMHQIVSLYENAALEKDIAIDIEIDDQQGTELIGDEDRIRQVIGNLLSNAVKFTHEGCVSVKVDITSSGAKDYADLRVDVRDQGIGIPKDKLPLLFQPFEQVEGAHTRRYGGTGLGLSICKKLCDAMGGTISVVSQPEKGSVFTFEITLEEAEKSAQSETLLPTKAIDRAKANHLRVLAAEDVKTNQFLLEKILKDDAGYDLTIVGDGQQAVDAIAAHDFDVVLMDIQMPIMDGVAATQAIRAMEGPKNAIPIIGLTANAMADQRQEYLDQGMDDCLTKPIDWDALFVMLRHVKIPDGEDIVRLSVIPDTDDPVPSLYWAEYEGWEAPLKERLDQLAVQFGAQDYGLFMRRLLGECSQIRNALLHNRDDAALILDHANSLQSIGANYRLTVFTKLASDLEQKYNQDVALNVIIEHLQHIVDAMRQHYKSVDH